MAPSICLNMIVKNESRVIQRCLESVRPFFTTWVIVDTGSTDGTQDIIRNYLKDVPGQLHERPWKNFGHNRTEALKLAKGTANYYFVMDADEVVKVPPGWTLPATLDADEYLLMHRNRDHGDTGWERGAFFKQSLPWRYEGVLHEYMRCDRKIRRVSLEGPVVIAYPDGARNFDPIAKYSNDAKVLEAALVKEPTNARYAFYLARSYRDSRQFEAAIAAYERRAKMKNGLVEEAYYSLYEIAVLKQTLGHEWSSVRAAYERAHRFRPTRAEPVWAVAAYYRSVQNWPLAKAFAETAVKTPRPEDILFVDDSVYEWRALDELAIATYFTGEYARSAELNRQLLASGKVPEDVRPRIQANLTFAEQRLAEATAPAASKRG